MANAKDIQEVSKPVAEVPSESTTKVQVLSTTDSFVSDLVKEQPTLAQVMDREIVRHNFVDPLELPEECKARHRKEFCYSWLNKDKELSVRLRTSGWVLCNRTNSPYIKPHRFGGHGAVEQSGMLLAFMPEKHYQVLEAGPAELSRQKVKYYTEDLAKRDPKDAPIGFYKPEDKGDE